jgi:hypothetical protein
MLLGEILTVKIGVSDLNKGLLPQVLKMLTIKIWHIGDYSSEECFEHYDTKPSVGRCADRCHIEMMMRRKKRRMRRKMRRRMRRRRVAFKAGSSSKGKAKQDTSSEDEGSFLGMMKMKRRCHSL